MQIFTRSGQFVVFAFSTVSLFSVACFAGASDRHVNTQEGEDRANKKSADMPDGPALALGHRFLNALQKDDVDAFVACWMGEKEMLEALKNLPAGVEKPNEKQLAGLKQHLVQRDEVIKLVFSPLRKAITDKCGKLDAMVVATVKPSNVQQRRGLTRATSIVLEFTTGSGETVKYNVDDGVQLNEKWYFSDKPDLSLDIVSKEGSSETVFLKEYANEQEKKKLGELDQNLRRN